eukprot:COSAG06_NODE_2628_length_6556_cov_4.840948_7_plen_228_part_00
MRAPRYQPAATHRPPEVFDAHIGSRGHHFRIEHFLLNGRSSSLRLLGRLTSGSADCRDGILDLLRDWKAHPEGGAVDGIRGTGSFIGRPWEHADANHALLAQEEHEEADGRDAEAVLNDSNAAVVECQIDGRDDAKQRHVQPVRFDADRRLQEVDVFQRDDVVILPVEAGEEFDGRAHRAQARDEETEREAYNNDAFQVSETDSATSRESATFLQRMPPPVVLRRRM